MYKICVYVPTTHLETVKTALFEAGAGTIGNYDCCSWQVAGEGQFRPLTGAQPYIGNPGSVQRVAEYRLEMVCADEQVKRALSALQIAHPYEEPAYQIWRLADVSELPE